MGVSTQTGHHLFNYDGHGMYGHQSITLRESSFSESLTGQLGSFDREWEAALMGEAGFYDILHAANLSQRLGLAPSHR